VGAQRANVVERRGLAQVTIFSSPWRSRGPWIRSSRSGRRATRAFRPPSRQAKAATRRRKGWQPQEHLALGIGATPRPLGPAIGSVTEARSNRGPPRSVRRPYKQWRARFASCFAKWSKANSFTCAEPECDARDRPPMLHRAIRRDHYIPVAMLPEMSKHMCLADWRGHRGIQCYCRPLDSAAFASV